MIEWMQKHKKWLVLTIWISTISFIAAGMVGWGSYNFSLNESIVARVGKIDITQKQLQSRYAQLYAQSNTDGKMDVQKAQELGLENLALQSLIERALLQNFALDLGLRVTHEQIIQEIMQIDAFKKEGSFDSSLYKEILKQNNFKPSEFEAEISNDLLVKKIIQIIPNAKASTLEKNTFSLPSLIQDEVQIKILDSKDIALKPTQEEIKQFWEEHKQTFRNPAKTKIRSILISSDSQNPKEEDLQRIYEETKVKYLDKDGNVKDFALVRNEIYRDQQILMAEELALKEYLALKKGEAKTVQEQTIIEGDDRYVEILDLIKHGNTGDTFKPIKTSKGWLVVQILEKIPSQSKTFKEAQKDAENSLISQIKQEKLKLLAQELVEKGFKGKNLGFISWNQKLQQFSKEESQILLNRVFTSTQKRGSVNLEDKIVVFEILNQKISSDPTELQKAKESSARVVYFYKGQIITKEFYQYLQNRYKILTFKKDQ